jgi:uncharacterized protein DUF4912
MARRSKSPRAPRNGKSAAKPTRARPAASRGKVSAKSAAGKKARKQATESKAPAKKTAAPRKRTTSVTPPAEPVAAKRRARAVPAGTADVPASGRRRAAPRRSRTALAVAPAESEAGPAPSSPSVDDAVALPETYGRTRVRLLMQSPGRLFVHWDLSPGVVEELRGQIGRRAASLARLAVRITAPGNDRPLVVLLPRGARSWYVDVPPQRLEYRAELGLMLPSGEFRALAVSNPVRIPRTTPSPVPAGRRVPFARGEAPSTEAMGELPSDEATEEELAAGRGRDAAGTTVPVAGAGGSSELSRRGPRTRVQPDRALGGASDLRPGGSSSDLRPKH